jgi:hypothetical protein
MSFTCLGSLGNATTGHINLFVVASLKEPRQAQLKVIHAVITNYHIAIKHNCH